MRQGRVQHARRVLEDLRHRARAVLDGELLALVELEALPRPGAQGVRSLPADRADRAHDPVLVRIAHELPRVLVERAARLATLDVLVATVELLLGRGGLLEEDERPAHAPGLVESPGVEAGAAEGAEALGVRRV